MKTVEGENVKSCDICHDTESLEISGKSQDDYAHVDTHITYREKNPELNY